MSGGVAYIYDPDGDFSENLNREMADLEPINDADATWLLSAITRFYEATDSQVAAGLLERSTPLKDFVKVMPRDYRRVLEAIETAERNGSDVDEAIMAVSRG